MIEMNVPELSDDERRAALAVATAARRERAAVKQRLGSGQLSAIDVLELSSHDAVLAKLKVIDLLTATPRIGPVTAARVMEQVGIAQSRRLRGLGHHQRRALMDYLRGRD